MYLHKKNRQAKMAASQVKNNRLYKGYLEQKWSSKKKQNEDQIIKN